MCELAGDAIWTMTESWPVLPPGTTSGSVALQQQESVTTKGQVGLPVLGWHTTDMLMSKGSAELTTPLARVSW